MATSETKENICLMCFQAPAVRKVDTCEHSYCENCLSSPNFACPQCATEGGGGQEKNRAVSGGEEAQLSGHGSQLPSATDQTNATLVADNCRLCYFRGATEEAVNICKECKSIPLCRICSKTHRENRRTQHHVVTAITTLKTEEVLCKTHDESLQLFCTTCSANVCNVCVLLDHEVHVVKTFNDVVNTEVEKVRSDLENEERWLNMLKSDEKELRESKATAQDIEDVLIKSIEDHAEKCIEEIIKSKETLKKQIRTDFEVVRVMEKRLETMLELQRGSREVVAAANQLLNEQVELHSTYVEKLVTLKERLDKLMEDHHTYDEDKAKYQQTFKELCKKAITFYPRTPNCKIGGFEDIYYAGPRCKDSGPCVCGSCEKAFKWPIASRVAECRQKGKCTCGTCGCTFNRKMLIGNGCCAKQRHTPNLMTGFYIEMCRNQIASGDFEFP